MESLQKANMDAVYIKSQTDNFIILNDPYLVQAPLQKVFVIDPNREAGTKLNLRVDGAKVPELSVSDNIYSNGNLVLTDFYGLRRDGD